MDNYNSTNMTKRETLNACLNKIREFREIHEEDSGESNYFDLANKAMVTAYKQCEKVLETALETCDKLSVFAVYMTNKDIYIFKGDDIADAFRREGWGSIAGVDYHDSLGLDSGKTDAEYIEMAKSKKEESDNNLKESLEIIKQLNRV